LRGMGVILLHHCCSLSAFFSVPTFGRTATTFGKQPPIWSMSSPADVVVAAADGDIAAALEVAILCVAGSAAVSAASGLVQREAADATFQPPPMGAPTTSSVSVDVDLGSGGEPAGPQRIYLKPLLLRSELLLVHLPIPLGMLVEEKVDHNGTIEVTGALPGFSAINNVHEGDIVRGLTAYREVIAGAPMWQQVTSGTPMGTRQLKRCFFRVDANARYADVRDAIASHRSSEGGNGVVTLVVERAINSSTPLPVPSPQSTASKLKPLQDIVWDDLRRGPAKAPDECRPEADPGGRWRRSGLGGLDLGVHDRE